MFLVHASIVIRITNVDEDYAARPEIQ